MLFKHNATASQLPQLLAAYAQAAEAEKAAAAAKKAARADIERAMGGTPKSGQYGGWVLSVAYRTSKRISSTLVRQLCDAETVKKCTEEVHSTIFTVTRAGE